MSWAQALESRHKYGVLGAGAVSKSLIFRLPGKTRDMGPVSAVSYRVASRIANALRAGYPVRTASELNHASVILFHAPADQAQTLLGMLEAAEIDWASTAVVFCDCDVDAGAKRRLDALGASTAVAREFGIPGRIAVEGRAAALTAAHRMARELQLKPVEISPGSTALFDAAVTLGNAALTPLIDRAATLLRAAGIRDTEAVRIASALFEQTARVYARSGRQSWAWYIRAPEMVDIRAQIAAVGPDFGPVFRQLLLYGLDAVEKYSEVADELRTRHSKASSQ
jgi:uncharacterized protein DUF2520